MGMLPYGDAWRASRRTFTKYFNPSNSSINQQHEMIYVRRFLGQLLQEPNDFLPHIRTYCPFTIFLLSTLLNFLMFSHIGSIILLMTYSIHVRPYNDPYIKTMEEAVEAVAEISTAGTFLVDVIPIFKYVPEWFPGAKFQTLAARTRKHAAIVRNATFEVTQKLMVCDLSSFFTGRFLSKYLTIYSQASGNCDPSFVTEALSEIEYSDTPNQDIDLVKDVAAQAYIG